MTGIYTCPQPSFALIALGFQHSVDSYRHKYDTVPNEIFDILHFDTIQVLLLVHITLFSSSTLTPFICKDMNVFMGTYIYIYTHFDLK